MSAFSQSDGSTETLSVMDVDEPGDHQRHAASYKNLEGGADKDSQPSVAPQSERSEVQRSNQIVQPSDYCGHNQEAGPDSEELDPQCRSLSMDSAYGTLSPESFPQEMQPQPGQSEGEETEEEEAYRGSQEEELVQVEMEEDEEEEDASLGSQLSVVQSSKPRRRPHVQSKLQCLQRLSSMTLSRSEDNLLQHFHSKIPTSDTHSLSSEDQELQCGDMDISSLVHSKSLSELNQNGREMFSSDLNQSEDCLSMSLPSDKLKASLSRAEAQCCHRASDGPREGDEILRSSSDGGMAPSGCVEKKCELLATSGPRHTSPKKRKSPAQQHKKLTLAQLYRIRTTLVLNSTLTAS